MSDSSPGEMGSCRGQWLAAVEPSGIAMLWIGMILAVGLAAGTKFQAPSLTMPVALDVGRHVFETFGNVEFALVGFLCVVSWLRDARTVVWCLLAGVAGLLLVQAFWLRPALDARAMAIIAGDPVQDSWFHLGYVAAEAAKLTTLLAIATVGRLR